MNTTPAASESTAGTAIKRSRPSQFAGIPATKICMNCHSEMWAVAPALEPVRESYRTGKSDPMDAGSRSYREFVYFDHSIHVHKGIGCSECHGRVDRMPLTWQAQPLTMAWCLDCHRNPGMHVRPRDQVFDMAYYPPAEPGGAGTQTRKRVRDSEFDQLLDMPPMSDEDQISCLGVLAAESRPALPIPKAPRGAVFWRSWAPRLPWRGRRVHAPADGIHHAVCGAAREVIPGRPSTSRRVLVNGMAQGIVVESHLGRPTKVEGNPAHPASLGATDVHGQSCVLDLYDPDRAKQITELGEPSEWEVLSAGAQARLRPLGATEGEGLYILTRDDDVAHVGRTESAVAAAFPNARWHQYDPPVRNSARAGAQLAFGRPVNTYYRLDRADVILALDSDFLACGPASTRYAHDYAQRRRVRGSNMAMNRLYSVESAMTLDRRQGRAPAAFAVSARSKRSRATLAAAVSSGAVNARIRSACARGFRRWRAIWPRIAERARSSPAIRNRPAVHALAHAMNASLGNAGTTVVYTDPIEVGAGGSDRVAARTRGRDGCGQAVPSSCSAGIRFTTRLSISICRQTGEGPLTIHVSLHPNETSALARWVIPERHFLEDWGDARAFDGTVTILQPLIQPLYHGRSHTGGCWTPWCASPRGRRTKSCALTGARIQAQAISRHGGGIRTRGAWSPDPRCRRSPSRRRHGAAPPLPAGIAGGPRPALPARSVHSRRPLCEQCLAAGASQTHHEADVGQRRPSQSPHGGAPGARRTNSMSNCECSGRSVRGSVWISPGQADDTAIVHLGYGRTHAGHVGNGAGFNAYQLRTSDALWAGSGAAVHESRRIVSAREYADAPEDGRPRHGDRRLATYAAIPAFREEENRIPEKQETLYPLWNYTGYAWGMSIDLTACVNCMACVIACQAENNIPVVGKEQVLANRAMHWLRVDTLLRRRAANPRRPLPARALHAVRAGALRTGLPGPGDGPQLRRAERHGL